jgi:hypothetical protein
MCGNIQCCNAAYLEEFQEQRPLGGAVAALGLSQKAVHADDEQPEAGAGDSAFNYSSGSDLAPNPAPSAIAGMLDMAHAPRMNDPIALVTCCTCPFRFIHQIGYAMLNP